MSAAGERVYRFAPLDRTGWLLGLSGAQAVALGAGIFVSGTLLEIGASAPIVLGPLALALAFAFGAWDRRPFHEWTLTILRHAIRSIRGRRWAATLPLLSGTSADDAKAPPLPPFLAGLVIIDAGPVAWSPRTAQT